MRNLIKIICLSVLCIHHLSYSQTTIEFIPVYGFQTFSLDKYYPINKSDSVKIDGLRFYVSSIQFLKSDAIVFSEGESYHLVDLSNPSTLKISFPNHKVDFTHVSFNLGIDSTTNVSGALSGDLDPTLGMYWTWQSGYINIKIEGKSNLCKTRLNEFSLHLGGYTYPNLAVKNIELPVKNLQKVKLYFDIYEFLKSVDLEIQNQIMSPGPAAVKLSEKFAKTFICREK